MRNFKISKRGFSLVELVVYLALLSLLLVVVVSLLSSLANTQKNFHASKNIENSGIYGFERMVREIRSAKSVDTLATILGTHPGVLKLNTTDSSGVAKTVEFFLSGTTLHVKEDGVDSGPLTPQNARVTNLVFRGINTGDSSAVKIEMAVEAGGGQYTKSGNFYSTVVLRGSY